MQTVVTLNFTTLYLKIAYYVHIYVYCYTQEQWLATNIHTYVNTYLC